ncbi:MAG: NADPH-dependent FMN reductase [Acidimicrobiales bacterium]
MSTAHPPPLSIAAVIGSLRSASFNRAVFDAAVDLAPAGVSLVEAPIVDVALFNQDLEGDGEPDAVVSLRKAVAAAEALIIFTPEFNRSMPGVTKNVVDWLSRPSDDAAIAGKLVGIVAASPGRGDAPGSRSQLTVAVTGAGGVVHDPTLGIASISRALSDGVLTDDAVLAAVGEWLRGFVAAARGRRSA